MSMYHERLWKLAQDLRHVGHTRPLASSDQGIVNDAIRELESVAAEIQVACLRAEYPMRGEEQDRRGLPIVVNGSGNPGAPPPLPEAFNPSPPAPRGEAMQMEPERFDEATGPNP